MKRGWALAVLVALLVVLNLSLNTASGSVGALVAVAGIVVLLAVARLLGLSWADLGLARGTWRRGARWGVVAIALVGVIYVVLLLTPFGRDLLADERGPDTLGAMLIETFVVIPVRTVLVEELAFRGVLWAYLRRTWSTRVATIWSSLAFGLWHVLPALGFAEGNDAAGDVVDQSPAGLVLVVVGTVLVTALGGVLLCEVRRRADSLLAPIGLHWAANGPGTIASYLAR